MHLTRARQIWRPLLHSLWITKIKRGIKLFFHLSHRRWLASLFHSWWSTYWFVELRDLWDFQCHTNTKTRLAWWASSQAFTCYLCTILEGGDYLGFVFLYSTKRISHIRMANTRTSRIRICRRRTIKKHYTLQWSLQGKGCQWFWLTMDRPWTCAHSELPLA